MKRLLLIPLIFLSACSSAQRQSSVLRATAVGQAVSSNGLRTEDQLREYRLGRYVDARDPLVMHEGHPVYRVETSARWDLRPNEKSSLPKRDAVQSPSISANDAVVAEVNKQRAATRAFTEQTATLNQRLSDLGEAVKQTKEMAEEAVALKRDVAALRQQLEAVEAKAPGQSQVKPTSSPDDSW